MKHKKKGYKPDLQQRKEYHGRATVRLPWKVRESQAQRSVNQRLADKEQLQKASEKELKAAAMQHKKKVAEEKRVAREEAKVVSDWAKAKKAAEIAIIKATQNTKKPQPTAQSGKNKASRASHLKRKRARGGGAGGGVESAASSPSPMVASPKVSSCSCTINIPSKFR
jgi:membrane protein involved in colicin uptake